MKMKLKKKVVKEKKVSSEEMFKETVKEPEVDKTPVKKEVGKKELVILKTFTQPDPHWMVGVQMICSICGAKDHFAYEMLSIKGSTKKMDLVCYNCIAKAGYTRVLRKSGWDWTPAEGLLGRE